MPKWQLKSLHRWSEIDRSQARFVPGEPAWLTKQLVTPSLMQSVIVMLYPVLRIYGIKVPVLSDKE